MRNPSLISMIVIALAAGSACRTEPDRSAGPPRSPTPSPVPSPLPPAASPGTEPFRSPTAAPTPSPGPGSTAQPGGSEPDFSGTGCFPDVPTPLSVTAFPERTPRSRTEPVRIVVEIRATERAVVGHRHGQEFDVSVDKDGEEVWRWSAVAPFTDPYGYSHTYEPGDVRRFSAVWDGSPWEDDPPRGDYLVHGYLVGNMESPPPTGRFICFDDAPLTLT